MAALERDGREGEGVFLVGLWAALELEEALAVRRPEGLPGRFPLSRRPGTYSTVHSLLKRSLRRKQ